jgi:hypothetical protein
MQNSGCYLVNRAVTSRSTDEVEAGLGRLTGQVGCVSRSLSRPELGTVAEHTLQVPQLLGSSSPARTVVEDHTHVRCHGILRSLTLPARPPLREPSPAGFRLDG